MPTGLDIRIPNVLGKGEIGVASSGPFGEEESRTFGNGLQTVDAIHAYVRG